MAALEEEDKEPEAPTFSWMPADCVPMADGEYDAIVMGTGLKECIMSGLLSTMGKKARRRRPAFFFSGLRAARRRSAAAAVSGRPRGAAAGAGPNIAPRRGVACRRRFESRRVPARRRGSRTETAPRWGVAFRRRFENRRVPTHFRRRLENRRVPAR